MRFKGGYLVWKKTDSGKNFLGLFKSARQIRDNVGISILSVAKILKDYPDVYQGQFIIEKCPREGQVESPRPRKRARTR
jgi:hypothetical protein